MSSSEPERTPDVSSSPIARKQCYSNAFPVTPSPMKDCGSKRPFIDNEPSFNAWKMSRTTPPTKVTDDPFIDNDRKSPSKSGSIRDKKIHEQMLIPVTTKMINSAVSEDNQFFLKDGCLLHLVKVVGAVVHYHEYWNNDVIGIEDGTGKIRIVLVRCQNLECSGVKELYRKCTVNTYVRVIRMVKDDFNLRTIVASDIRPVSTGNELTYHLLEVAYSADKVMTRQMEEKLDAELMAVDLNHVICEYQSAIDKKQKAIRLIDSHNTYDDDDLNDTELNSLITEHMKDIANEKL